MTPESKKPYRVKYIFRDRSKMWITPPKERQVMVPVDLSKLPKGMTFERMDEIIRQRAAIIHKSNSQIPPK
jgi:hypothetical protein